MGLGLKVPSGILEVEIVAMRGVGQEVGVTVIELHCKILADILQLHSNFNLHAINVHNLARQANASNSLCKTRVAVLCPIAGYNYGTVRCSS